MDEMQESRETCFTSILFHQNIVYLQYLRLCSSIFTECANSTISKATYGDRNQANYNRNIPYGLKVQGVLIQVQQCEDVIQIFVLDSHSEQSTNLFHVDFKGTS